jgi:hypothetical protein
MTSAGPMVLGIDRSHPRLARFFSILTITGAVAVVGGLLMLRGHR